MLAILKKKGREVFPATMRSFQEGSSRKNASTIKPSYHVRVSKDENCKFDDRKTLPLKNITLFYVFLNISDLKHRES